MSQESQQSDDEVERLRGQVSQLQAENNRQQSEIERLKAEKKEILDREMQLQQKTASEWIHRDEILAAMKHVEAIVIALLYENAGLRRQILNLKGKGEVNDEDLNQLAIEYGEFLNDDTVAKLENDLGMIPKVKEFFREHGPQQDETSRAKWWKKLLFAIVCGAAGCLVGGAFGAVMGVVHGPISAQVASAKVAGGIGVLWGTTLGGSAGYKMNEWSDFFQAMEGVVNDIMETGMLAQSAEHKQD